MHNEQCEEYYLDNRKCFWRSYIYASKHVGSKSVYDCLNLLIQELKKLEQSTRDLEIRKITFEA